MSLKKGDIIEGQIEDIAFGGDGILRHRGQVVFVPLSAKGDRVTGKIHSSKKSFARAELPTVLEPSPHRTNPRCSYFGRCGGCQFQHISYDQQLSAKRKFVEDALTRIGHLQDIRVEPITKAEQQWAYRRHIRLHAGPDFCGYLRQDDQGLIEVDHCVIFDLEPAAIIKDISATIKAHHLNATLEISLFKAAGRYVALFDFKEGSPPALQTFEDALKNNARLQGIIWRWGEHHRQVGACSLYFQLDGLKLSYSPLAFVQAHPEESAKLYKDLTGRMQAAKRRVLDLYCGIGATSLLLARDGAEVLAIEGNQEAIRLAHENAAINSIDRIEWRLGNVDELIDDAMQTFNPDMVLVNPPRTGLSDKVKEILLRHLPNDIFYISCMPATLARDLRELYQGGYQAAYCKPYDMFPQTTHVETLVHLKKSVL